jgi:hypothetical protein
VITTVAKSPIVSATIPPIKLNTTPKGEHPGVAEGKGCHFRAVIEIELFSFYAGEAIGLNACIPSARLEQGTGESASKNH